MISKNNLFITPIGWNLMSILILDFHDKTER